MMNTQDILKQIKFDANGLVPAIAQDYKTGEILMMAWMNEESLKLSIESKQATYWSRSRKEIWIKGKTSGNLQEITEMFYDCDADAILIKVKQTGPACHTGKPSCFFNKIL